MVKKTKNNISVYILYQDFLPHFYSHIQLKLSVQMTFAIYTFLFWCIVGIYYFRLQSDAHFNMYHELYVKYEQL